MAVLKFLEDNWDIIISNSVPFLAVSVLTAGGIWAYAKHYYSGRIEDLKEKISLRDDQIKYYKELSETKQPPPGKRLTEDNGSNLRNDILKEIQFFKQHAGKALSMELFARLEPKYLFNIVLSELLLMNKNNEITWPEAPEFPQHYSDIAIIQNDKK